MLETNTELKTKNMKVPSEFDESIDFATWYSGMERPKVEKAFVRYLKEVKSIDLASSEQKPLAKNKQTQEQKFKPCAVELLSCGTETCDNECEIPHECEFLRADATSR